VWAEGGARAGARDIPGARDNYGEAVKLFAQVLETSNAENLADNSRNLSIALKNYGAALSTLGDHTLGIEQYRRAEVLDRDRVTRDPTNTTWQLDLSYSLASLASSERQVGRLDEAVRHYEQALELRQGVLKVDPVNDQAEDAVARAHETLAMTLNQRGDRARALESALAAVRARERRATARPAEIELRNQLIDSVGTLYNVRVELAKAAHGADARQAWQDARAAIARVAQLQDETSRAGAKRVAGPDRAALAREIAQCDAALASLR
jgi:tetratricopeptide (TPR) repeat protein